MNNKHLALAAALASAFAVAACGGSDDTATTGKAVTVQCEGVNACAGQGACEGVNSDGTTHTCAGNNACAGQGWVELTADECAAKGGTAKA